MEKKRKPSELSDICYKRNYLRNVIVRFDFTAAEESLNKKLPANIRRRILESFPIEVPSRDLQQVTFDMKRQKNTNARFVTNWTFHTEDRSSTLTISQNFIFLSTELYVDYETFSEPFLSILREIQTVFPDTYGSRFGLRYINVIRVDEPKPLFWKDYLSESILGNFDTVPADARLLKLVTQSEFRFENASFRLNFGIENPDYPAPVARKEFLLDLDAYLQGQIEINETKETLDNFHRHIQETFESLITDKLRKLMMVKSA